MIVSGDTEGPRYTADPRTSRCRQCLVSGHPWGLEPAAARSLAGPGSGPVAGWPGVCQNPTLALAGDGDGDSVSRLLGGIWVWAPEPQGHVLTACGLGGGGFAEKICSFL